MNARIHPLLGLGLSGALLLGGCIQLEADPGKARRPKPTTPEISLELIHADGACTSTRGQLETVCPGLVLPGDLAVVSAEVDWGKQPAGAIEVSDTCGGSFLDLSEDPVSFEGHWQVPIFGTDCTLTVEAIGVDGDLVASSTLLFEVSMPPSPVGIQAYVILLHSNGECRLTTEGNSEVVCDPMVAGDRATWHVEVDWGSAEPGIIEMGDSCGGDFTYTTENNFFVQGEWQPPTEPDTLCTFAVFATSADNWSHGFKLRVPLAAFVPAAQ